MRIFCLNMSLLVMCVVVSGCMQGGQGGTMGRVSGIVLLHGSPLETGTVIFEDSGRGVSASASITAGKFKFETPIEVGSFRVAVTPPPLPAPHEMSSQPTPAAVQNPIPEKYRVAGKSGLEARVEPGSNQFEFKLD